MSMPVYRSLAESFRLNIYLPECGLIAPPTATYKADAQLDEVMKTDRPPQSVLINVDDGLAVDGAGTLADCMKAIRGRAVPIIRFETEEAGEAIAQYIRENNIGDVTLCAPYALRGALAEIRKSLPLSRGMLDMRDCAAPDIYELVGECQKSEATMLMMKGRIDRELVRRLQKRFVQVWLEADGDIAGAALTGVCGVLTQDTDKLYDLLAKLPEGAALRPTPLYAHKTYHVTGEYPENSVKGCVAAGRLGYDAAEIDVKLTKDDVMVVHHDRDTKNLFEENYIVHEKEWERLKQIRRKAFPEDGLDTMDSLMREMAAYPETPVLIEIKTPADTFGVEEMVRQLKEMLPREDVQKGCTLIMGVMPPYLSYVHEQLPYLPAAHCTYVKGEQATDSIDENNLRLYKFAMETRGANAGFNPYHPMIGRTFARLAHARGVTVFPWTWAFEEWEDCKEGITASYMQGHDGLTSDWVGKFYHVPVDVRAELPEIWKAGEALAVQAEALTRGGEWARAEGRTEIFPLDDGIEPVGGGAIVGKAGKGRVAVGVWTGLEGGRQICVVSRAYEIEFR